MQPDSLEPDDIKSVPVEVVRNSDPQIAPRNVGGRPVKLNVKRFLAICDWIQKGHSNHNACKLESVEYSLFRLRVRTRRRWQWRYELADKIRDEYTRDIHLSNIVRHAVENWQASAWILERKFPGEFSLKQVVRDNGDAETQPLCERISLTQLAENARLMAETLANPPPGLMFHEEHASPGSEEAAS